MNNQNGQGLLEYVILTALIVLVCVSSAKLLGKEINSKIEDIKEKIDTGVTVRLSPK